MVAAVLSRPAHAVVFLLLVARQLEISAFQIPARQVNQRCSAIRVGEKDIADLIGPNLDEEDVVLYSDDDIDDDDNWGAPSETAEKHKSPILTRWDSLNPKIKERIVKEAQDRAIRNKKRREPAAEKKKRLYDQYREMNQQSKRDKHVRRNLAPNSKERTMLSDITPGDTMPGQVISITRFGAYVDIGSEVDGLLHVSQITRDEFVTHPRQFFSPGDEVEVRVVRLDSEMKKLQLTMLPEEVLEEENVMNKHEVIEEEDDRIQLDEVEVDDELWGEIRRVTDYGAYVELGATVRGFLHFMDHPMFGEVAGSHPKEFMSVGDRVRIWVLDVDETQKRIKLTANRPSGLPGPRREIQWV
mmetsp:Transcript_28918/g.61603  ORF Transcript_28918/g.61603 Transcript_28918/m.61603 type:complete len:357 (+) Transcript_28918:34-1104(+)|eukprot:CAMPEP_0172310340 /NCGR_PEP_ID=MMETSP1058-20130122/11430_1 /TAXON_ID=83371 /ORGANISM="Detonula confervacea, Strain CCMP 353" /LENGTH=356 /DNA_ID=CAMNT_0013023135 /DNA_START=9 /DNA_END=1079 /DNA_ORIENTATION=+